MYFTILATIITIRHGLCNDVAGYNNVRGTRRCTKSNVHCRKSSSATRRKGGLTPFLITLMIRSVHLAAANYSAPAIPFLKLAFQWLPVNYSSAEEKAEQRPVPRSILFKINPAFSIMDSSSVKRQRTKFDLSPALHGQSTGH